MTEINSHHHQSQVTDDDLTNVCTSSDLVLCGMPVADHVKTFA